MENLQDQPQHLEEAAAPWSFLCRLGASKTAEGIIQPKRMTRLLNSFLKWKPVKCFLHLSVPVAYEKNGLWALPGATEMRGRTWLTAPL